MIEKPVPSEGQNSEQTRNESTSDDAACSRFLSAETEAEIERETEEVEPCAANVWTREYVVSTGAARRLARQRDDARHRLSVIAADAAAIRDEWLEAQPEGIRLVIANIRRHANLSENEKCPYCKLALSPVASAAASAVPMQIKSSCQWSEDSDGNWDTACGETFTFTDGGPKENRARWCPYCGGELVAAPYPQNVRCGGTAAQEPENQEEADRRLPRMTCSPL
jgi:hypothetical protein